MKNCLSKSRLAIASWYVDQGNAQRNDFETGVVRISRLKKISALKKSHKLTKFGGATGQ